MQDLLRHTLSLAGGFLMRPCCAVPAALALMGFGGAGIAAAVALYRPWFLLMALAFFGVSFHWNFIRNRSRAGMAVWGASLLLALAIQLGPELADAEAPGGAATLDQEMTMTTPPKQATVELRVTGMACSACAARLERVLTTSPGVAEATVDFDCQRARVVYDPRQVDPPGIAQRIERTGFKTQAGLEPQMGAL